MYGTNRPFNSLTAAWRALVALLLLSGLSLAHAQPPRVVVSIAPLHSLVAGVMDGVGEPQLLIAANASPHAYSLRPSEARALSRAELVIWVGEALENMLVQPLHSLAGQARVLSLAEAEGIWLLPLREGGVWDAHDHASHASHGTEQAHGHQPHGRDHHGKGHDHAKKHDHEPHGHAKKHDHARHAHGKQHGEGHHDHSDHSAGHGEAVDAHLWLAPRNASRIVALVADELAALDPANAARYHHNAEQMGKRITQLERALTEQLAPLQGRPYVVFHDAYRYFEDSFGLTPAGSITVSPEQSPGARRIREIRQTIAERGAECVFSEPQFRPAIVKVVIEGSGARAGELDPLGAAIPPGPDHWFDLMVALGQGLVGCMQSD